MGTESATKLFRLSINFDPEREANRKITTLLLVLDSLFQKTEESARWFFWRVAMAEAGGFLTSKGKLIQGRN
jgi:hypothetical protein